MSYAERNELVFDDEINVKDTVNRDDVIVKFGAGGNGIRYGKFRAYRPRKKEIEVKVKGFKKHFRANSENTICAYRGERGDRDMVKIVWSP